MVENLAVALMFASWLKMCSKWRAYHLSIAISQPRRGGLLITNKEGVNEGNVARGSSNQSESIFPSPVDWWEKHVLILGDPISHDLAGSFSLLRLRT
jgi:hypothetical protein